MSKATLDVMAERGRQIDKEGWTPQHDDDLNADGQLALAAACYALCDVVKSPLPMWPWSPEWWKPTDRRRNLVKAAALILAEIDRIDRAKSIAGEVLK